ncbi:MAG: phytanoyl-CoA dioxygenase family protein [Henriciella sp.]|nr:phytanoyl-CoA dioxygenase family protein [Henriciella sp.]
MPHSTDISEGSLSPWLNGRPFAEAFAEYDQQGYIIFESVLSTEEIAGYQAALEPHMVHRGRNDFEGLRTNRVYALLAKSPLFADMVQHPLALAFAEAELGRSCLLSACLAIRLHSGETVQPWHTDDGTIKIPMPRRAFGVSAFWALDDTTEDNGATEIVPGSHLWTGEDIRALNEPDAYYSDVEKSIDHDPYAHPDAIKATMPAGSLMIAKGTLLHRGGSNRTDRPRTIVTPQYCVGWARQLENMMAVTPKDITTKLPKRVRELMGYSIEAPFMGYVDGVHPEKLLA